MTAISRYAQRVMFIDSHNHLNDHKLLPHVEVLLAAMAEAGVDGALVVGSDIPSSYQAVELAQAYPQLRAAIGVHPHEAKILDADAMAALCSLAVQPQVVAVGEIGLDFYYDHSPRDVQREAFRRQLALAAECNLPIIIHEREAVDEVAAILDAEDGWARGGSWHCCSVTPDRAVEISRRLYVGIAGWITFPKAANIRTLASAVPSERLLLETDSPYITPVPHRGKPNQPAYVALVAQALALLKGTTAEDVGIITTANVMQAFPRWPLAQGKE